MEEAFTQLWASIPSVNELEAEKRIFAEVTEEDARKLMMCLHRACYANVDDADGTAAVDAAFKSDAAKLAPIDVPPPVVEEAPAAEGEAAPAEQQPAEPAAADPKSPEPVEQKFGFGLSWLKQIIHGFVLPQWIDVDTFSADVKSPAIPTAAVPATPEELAVVALANCVVDDRAPNQFLQVDDVLLLPKSRTISTHFKDYINIKDYPTHEPIYDVIWESIVGKGNATAQATKAQFTSWFSAVYIYVFSNATPQRAQVAAQKEWLDVIATTGECTAEAFRFACVRIARLYAKAGDVIGFFTEFIDAVKQKKSRKEEGQLLANPVDLHVLDDLDAEAREDLHFRSEAVNRILVTGNELVGKTTLGAALAKRLNAVHLDAFTLAVEATENPADELGTVITTCVTEQKPVPLEVQTQLIKRCLQQPATNHRGFVLSDLPNVVDGDVKAAEAFVAGLDMAKIPQAVVDVHAVPAMYKEWRERGASAAEEEYNAELRLREEEQAEKDRLAAEEAAKEERRKKREERAERRAKIEAGELEPTEEDQAEDDEGDEEPEEEAEQEVDEEGNPLDPEVIAARKATAQALVERRKFVADLKKLMRQSRAINHEAPQMSQQQLPSLVSTVEICSQRDRAIRVPCFEQTADTIEYVVERLGLTPTTIPTEPTLPEDMLEGIEAGPEGDVTLGENKQRFMTETLGLSFSKWQKHCPVTWREQHVLVEGAMVFSCSYRGYIYAFASSAKMQRFIASPHEYLVEPMTKHAPVLCVYRHGNVLSQANIPEDTFEADVAASLGLTPITLGEFSSQWASHRAEVARRLDIFTSRTDANEAKSKAREERRRKKLEAEAKKKKAAEKGKKKKKAAAQEEEPPVAETPVDEAPADANEEVEAPVETTEERIEKLIAVELQKQAIFFPQFVSCRDISEEKLEELFEHRVLPTTVLVLEHNAPRPLNEDGEPIPEEEDEEPEPEEEEPEPELDEEGNPIPAPPKPPKVFDPTDEKQYKRLTKKFIERFVASAEADAEPAEVAEGEPQPEPPQVFKVATLNTHGVSCGEMVADVYQAICPTAQQALPPQDGEDIIVDPEVEEPEEGQPIPDQQIIAGKKAIHQFGDTLRFCPFQLKEKGMLVAGDTANWLSYKGQKFLFAAPESMDVFKRNPTKYVATTPRDIPAPRLWLLGVPSAGKRTLAASLGKKFNIPMFKYDQEFFNAFMAAASSETGGNVDGLSVPSSIGSPHLARAQAIADELAEFDRQQIEKQELKDRTTKEQADRDTARENGEEVEDLDEEEEAEIAQILEFEPEETEAKQERVGKAERQMCAALTRVEPFESRGYVLCERPANETEFQQLIAEGCVPEVVIHLRLSVELYVARRIDDEMAKREEDWATQTAAIEEKKKEIMRKQRELELKRWRRRNIGADDDEPAADEEEPPEDIEPVNIDTVKSELEGQHDEHNNNVQSVIGLLPDARVPMVEINGDAGRETVVSSCVDSLASNLLRRRSLLEAPQVVFFDDAMELINSGAKHFSSYRFVDPVAHRKLEECGTQTFVEKGSKKMYEGEELVPEPEPEPPKPKKKKIVKKEDDEGNEYEVEEDEEEEEVEPEEPEPEEEPEAEPELSPEELEEMDKEHQTKVQAAKNLKKMRAAILRNRIYFFENDANLKVFLNDPLHFWDQPPPLANVSTIVATYEDEPEVREDNTKPRALSYQIAFNAGLSFIDLPKLLKWCFNKACIPSLSNKAKQLMLSGDSITSDFLSIALVCRLQAVDVLRKGAVVHNLPRSPITLSALVADGVTIHKVLTMRDTERMVRDIDKVALVSHRVTHPVHTMAALVECINEIRSSVTCRQQLKLRRQMAFPAPLHDTATTNDHLAQNLSVFKWYCPMNWSRGKQLLDMRENLRYAAEYLGAVYCFSSEKCSCEFWVHPETFTGEEGPKLAPLPQLLPQRLEAGVQPSKELELCGCCPVTLYSTRHEVGLKGITEPKAVKGQPDLIAQYDGKYYAMVDEDSMQSFLRQPWVFSKGAVLPMPHKLPFDPATLKTMPDDHYITHALYENIARSMLAVARTRPKFPGLSVEESALKYVALHLKANNAQNTTFRDQAYKENFNAYVERATLYETITTTAPEDPKELEKFDHRCKVWDDVQDDMDVYKEYIKLKAEGVEAAPVTEGTK